MYGKSFVSAVIVAAGSSTRMKSNISKQLIELCGVPVLVHTVTAFVNSDFVDEIIVVCPESEKEVFKERLSIFNPFPIKLVSGGATRQKSVFNGVSSTNESCDFVAIHDGARPLVTKECIGSVVRDGIEYSASTLAVQVKDTIKSVDGDVVVSTPERDKLRIIQTPQVFDKALYKKAYDKAALSDSDFTDDCQLLESIGVTVHVTPGDYSNIKITTPEDIAVAEAFLKLRGENR